MTTQHDGPRPYTLCLRCKRPFNEHSLAGVCFNGLGTTLFRRHVTSNFSQSFRAPEVRWLSQLLTMVASGRDISNLVKHKEFSRVSRKVRVLLDRVHEREAKGRPNNG